MNFEQEILRVLTLAGDNGLKVEKIARHVFNACNSMFNPLDYKSVHAFVSQYLIKCSKDPSSVVCKAERHGVYRINFKAQMAQQLLLKFSPHPDEQSDSNPTQNSNSSDLSLSLFD